MVSGWGGARADFVAGWLGLLPMFINNKWTIDPETGLSHGFQINCRELDHQPHSSIYSVLSAHGCSLDEHAEFTLALACHGYSFQPEDYLSYINQGAIKFLSIDIRGADYQTILWEYLVKTYMSHRRTLDSVKGHACQWGIDFIINAPVITDQDRIDQMNKLLNQKKYFYKTRALPPTIPSLIVNYNQLFNKGGSRYLCQVLEINVPDSYHQYWDNTLLSATSPKQIKVWDTNWSIQQVHVQGH